VSAAPAAGGATAGGSTLRAWLEVLRAPLLLSPCADVLAGWSLAFTVAFVRASAAEPSAGDAFRAPGAALAAWPVLLRAMLTGMCLLAAGMAQNAVADVEDDRRRKPGRPIPRGALSVGAARAAWVGLTLMALVVAASVSERLLDVAAAIAALTWLYHFVLKRWRLPGCAALGALRGLDLALGGVALMAASAGARPGSTEDALRFANLGPVLLTAPGYAAYMACASLHASTDDEPGARAWSRLGLGAAVALLLILLVLTVAPLLRAGETSPVRWLSAVLVAAAILRLARAWRRLPPPAVTGVALSNLYLFDASVVCFGNYEPLALGGGAFILALFVLGRLFLRIVPPS
jgi:4-hydroxybenzoate polyprenyltransferase